MMSLLSLGLNNNTDYKNKIFPALKSLVNDNNKYVYQTDFGLRKVWEDENSTHQFMFYQNINTLTIFCSKKMKGYVRSEPFGFQLKQIKSGELFVPDIKLKVVLNPNNDNSLTKKEPWTTENEKAKTNDSPHLVMGIVDNMPYNYDSIIDASSMKEYVDAIHTYLKEKNYLTKEITENDWQKTGEALAKNSYVQELSNDLINNLNEIIKYARKLNLSQENQFIFNDGDYRVWLPKLENTICFRDQEIKFMATYKGNNWQIYHYDTEYTKYKTEKSMIEAMVNGTLPLDNRVLFVQNGKPIYVGNYLEVLLMDTDFSLEMLKEEWQETSQEKKKQLKP